MALDKYSFFQNVFDVVRLIPKGNVTTYGAIAHYLGAKGSSRMVGWAMNASIPEENIPAHRVVNRIGVLTGKHHFATPTLMKERLEAEGIKVKNDKVVHFTEVFWDPSEHLKI
ncbi:MAG: MGMT family protein [Bacteroidota bacterium]